MAVFNQLKRRMKSMDEKEKHMKKHESQHIPSAAVIMS